MGRIVRELGEGVTKYYWYPGQKSDWIKTAIAIGAGGLTFALVYLITGNSLIAATVSASVTTGICGAFLGRRDITALEEFHDLAAERRAAMVDSGRAAWRGTVQGFVCAAAAVFVLNMPQIGFLADWALPVVPAVIGALAHTGGMVYERMTRVGRGTTADAGVSKELEPAG
ncbi:hypothetical protein LX16_0568 [Stackebrandtia albiflava]|uniref:Uncharacterized protein n=1 Tax=Stackebrandtia albiflava TaxID=406432 RepID=A0A562VAI2_9ACTN|nr:hypothetical protein [Stackebrandtia albiflava]TWJ14875.1 hypothetical protein LX16_0568 [Stackebrandtia albiflava]